MLHTFLKAARNPSYALHELPNWLDIHLKISELARVTNKKAGIGERIVVKDWESMRQSSDLGDLAHLQRYEWVLPLVKTSKLLLDDGCGSGYGTYYLAINGVNSVTGIDISRDTMKFAQKYYQARNLLFRKMDGCALQFEPESFDAIISFDVVEHIPYDKKNRFVAETARVLKPEGTLFVGCPNGTPGCKDNPFHYELDKAMFVELMSRYYENVRLLGQHTVGQDIRFDNLVIREEDADSAFGLLAICKNALKRQK